MNNELGKFLDNNPPYSAFESIKTKINDLYDEAKNWLDGQPITTQAQADALNTLADHIRKAATEADELRKNENKPFDDGKAEVQERYNVLIGKTTKVTGLTVKALDATNAALKPFLIEQARIQREAAAKARQVADEALEAAKAALADRDKTNLESVEIAEQLIDDAKGLEKEAQRIESAKAQAKGEGRAKGLRTVYTATMTSYVEAARWAYNEHVEAFVEFLNNLAAKEVRVGKRILPGFEIKGEEAL